MEQHSESIGDAIARLEQPGLREIATELGAFTLSTRASLRTVKRISELLDAAADPRELAVHILADQFRKPKREAQEIASWPDSVLAQLGREWANASLESPLPSDRAFFEAFRDALQLEKTRWDELFARSMEPLRKQFDTISTQMAEATKALSSSIATVAQQFQGLHTGFSFVVPTHNLFAVLPDLSAYFSDIANAMENVPDGEKALHASAYGFTKYFWPISFIVEIGRTKEHERQQLILESVAEFARGEDFDRELMRLVSNSSVLGPRSRIIQRAVKAQREGDYLVSVPLFFTQVEGVLSDALLLKKTAFSSNGKLYSLDATGQPAADKNGKYIEFRGLDSKARSLRTQASDEAALVAEHLMDYTAKDRNPILHGANVAYDSQELSTRTALALLIMCSLVSDFERGVFN